jgi:hypothetical protein
MLRHRLALQLLPLTLTPPLEIPTPPLEIPTPPL